MQANNEPRPRGGGAFRAIPGSFEATRQIPIAEMSAGSKMAMYAEDGQRYGLKRKELVKVRRTTATQVGRGRLPEMLIDGLTR